MKQTYLNFFLLVLLIDSSCKKETPPPEIPGTEVVYICNEGNFNTGSAEISVYDKEKKEVSNGLFESVNNYALGDVAQSFFIRDSVGFIVVNNSQKVEVVKVPSMKKLRTILIPGSSPRYCYALNDSIAYISELYKGVVYVVNYQSGVVIKEIEQVSRWTEHILKHGDDLLVEERNLDAFPSATAGFVCINTSSNTIAQRYSYAGSNINGMVRDRENRVWVLIEEDTAYAVASTLLCLNSDLSIHKTFLFPISHRPSLLRINGTGDEVYYMDDDIYRLSISDNQLPVLSFIDRNNRNFYTYDLDPQSGDIYISDALDFVQPSRVYRYTNDGMLIHSFAAGIIAGNFTFTN